MFRESIERLDGMAASFAAHIKERANFELAYEPACNIVCFCYLAEGDLGRLNQEIRKLLVEEGGFYIVPTILQGQLYLRVSLMNPLTAENELRELLHKIEEKASLIPEN